MRYGRLTRAEGAETLDTEVKSMREIEEALRFTVTAVSLGWLTSFSG